MPAVAPDKEMTHLLEAVSAARGAETTNTAAHILLDAARKLLGMAGASLDRKIADGYQTVATAGTVPEGEADTEYRIRFAERWSQ